VSTGTLELPKRFEVVQWRSVETVDIDDGNGEVRMRMVPYGREARLGVNLFETFERAAFAAAVNAPARCKMWSEHNGPLVGHARQVEDLPDGCYATMKFASTGPAQEARTLVLERFVDEVSVEFRAIKDSMKVRRAPDGLHVSHSRGHLLGAALVAHGVYGDVGSLVLSARGEGEDRAAEQRLARLKALSH
jgi:hypothetical protein